MDTRWLVDGARCFGPGFLIAEVLRAAIESPLMDGTRLLSMA